MAILQNFNLLIQNLNKNEEQMGYLFRHDLFHCLIIQKHQRILDVLNDADLEQEDQRREAELQDEEDKQEHQEKHSWQARP